MSDIDRLGKHITNTIIAINHKQDFPKMISKEIPIFKSYDYNTKFDVIKEVITTYETYCFELGNKGEEFNLPSIGKFKVKVGTIMWDEMKQEFAEEHGFASFEDIPASIVDAHMPELETKLKQKYFDQKLEKQLTKRKEMLIKRLEGM